LAERCNKIIVSISNVYSRSYDEILRGWNLKTTYCDAEREFVWFDNIEIRPGVPHDLYDPMISSYMGIVDIRRNLPELSHCDPKTLA
jgi:hypothetical protein